MKQGSISDEAWYKLSADDKGSLAAIRNHYIKYSKCSEQLSIDLELVDRSYEAMGHRFRSRINKATREYGRYVGELDGEISDRLRKIEEVFTSSGIKVDLSKDIDAWLKTHTAFISPLAMGGYAAEKRNKTLGTDLELVNLALKGFRENIHALKELGIPILPKKFKLFTWFPISIIRKKLLKLINSEFGRIALSGHANAAKNEMKRLSDDFFEVVKNVQTDMSSNQKLYNLSFA